jgi:phosphoserine phosphatase
MNTLPPVPLTVGGPPLPGRPMNFAWTVVVMSAPVARAVRRLETYEIFSQCLPQDRSTDFLVLAPGIAAEMSFTAETADEAQAVHASVVQAFAGEPVDVALVPTRGRIKRLLVADMDSTIIGQECIDELADLVGRKAEISAITEQAMRGEIAFEPALQQRVRQLAGIDLGAIDRLLAERIELNPGARTLVATMRRNGAMTALISGGFTLFTRAIAARAGFERNYANELTLANDRLTGDVALPILGAAAKLDMMQTLAAERKIDASMIIAVGDGANDLPMLEAAGMGVAYHAKPAVAERASVSLRHADLTGLLYLQGYPQSEHVAAEAAL